MDVADAELVVRAQTGDVDDDRDVEGATQDVFVQAWRNLGRFRGDAGTFTWLYRIAVNEALMRRRRGRPQLTELDENAPADAVSDHAGDLRTFLLVQIQKLPFELRAPLVLRDHEGLSNAEVAEALGLSLAAAKSRIHRARMQLRVALEEWERR